MAKYTVVSITPFRGGKKIVEVERTATTGCLWWRKHLQVTERYLTTYGHVWNAYPDGQRIHYPVSAALNDALGTYENQQLVNEELEHGH